MAMYLYLASANVYAITLFNHLGLFISYNLFSQKFRNIKAFNTTFIKKQASNCKLMGFWNNFEYRKNVVGKKIEDIVKFQFVTIAFCIKNG